MLKGTGVPILYVLTSRQAICALAAFVLLASNAIAAPDEIEISNLKQGLMHRKENGDWEVYQEGSRFLANQNGECVANREPIPCMWYGITFDYSANSRKTKLDCVSTHSKPVDVVNPREIVEEKVQSSKGEIVVRGRSGEMRLPGYIGTPLSGDETFQKMECYLRDELVLLVEFTLVSAE